MKPISTKHILMYSAYLCVAAALFCGGFAIGHHTGTGLYTAGSGAVIPAAATETAAPAETALPHSYRLILEDGELRLYQDSGGISHLISGEEISVGSYPVSDIASLKDGMIFTDLNQALALMENFLS